MTVSDELRDPWGWVAAGTVGGLGAVLIGAGGIAVLPGLLVGAGVLAVKVGVGLVTNRRPRALSYDDRRRQDSLPQPAPGSPAGMLLDRARTAVRRISQLADSPGDPWLAQQVGDVDDQAASALTSLSDVGGRVTLVEQTMAGNDPARLSAEVHRLRATAAAATDNGLRAETERAANAVEQQKVVADRLVTLHSTLLTRMETAVVGLEGLAARMGEVIALGAVSIEHDRAAALVEGLTSDLDTLRGGLDEAAAMSLPLPPQG